MVQKIRPHLPNITAKKKKSLNIKAKAHSPWGYSSHMVLRYLLIREPPRQEAEARIVLSSLHISTDDMVFFLPRNALSRDCQKTNKHPRHNCPRESDQSFFFRKGFRWSWHVVEWKQHSSYSKDTMAQCCGHELSINQTSEDRKLQWWWENNPMIFLWEIQMCGKQGEISLTLAVLATVLLSLKPTGSPQLDCSEPRGLLQMQVPHA